MGWGKPNKKRIYYTYAYFDSKFDQMKISKDKKAPVEFTRNSSNRRTTKSGDNGMYLYFNPFYVQNKGRRAKYIYIPGNFFSFFVKINDYLIFSSIGALVSMKYTEESCRCGLPYGMDQQGCQYFFHEEDGSPNWITDTRGLPIMHFEYPDIQIKKCIVKKKILWFIFFHRLRYIPGTGEKWIFESISELGAPVFTHSYPYGYKFQELDDETNLYHSRNGYMDPHLNVSLFLFLFLFYFFYSITFIVIDPSHINL